MIFKQSLGVVSYGAYVPSLVVSAEEIEQAQAKVGSGIPHSLGVQQKTLPASDEDTATMATSAGAQAVARWSGERSDIHALFVGSESHPYAVKPTGTIVKEALGLADHISLADLQFACKAGTQGLQIVAAYVAAQMMPAGLAIGADTAQSRPGDVLEFTAGAGAAAFILGSHQLLARLVATTSVATDTPDFWRRPGEAYPQHAGRFSGEPAYFHHVGLATRSLLDEVKLEPEQIDFCVFHTPNAKFPQAIAKKLGFKPQQLAPSLIVKEIGNTYAAASLLALVAVLDQAQAGQKILVTSYGSGSGSDSFLFETTAELVKQRSGWSQLIRDQIAQAQSVNYQEYRQNTGAKH